MKVAPACIWNTSSTLLCRVLVISHLSVVFKCHSAPIIKQHRARVTDGRTSDGMRQAAITGVEPQQPAAEHQMNVKLAGTRCSELSGVRRRLSVFIGKQYTEHHIWVSWCSVDLEAILQDNRRRTPMNADFIPDKLWSRFLPDILGFWSCWSTIKYRQNRWSRFSGTINYTINTDKQRYIRMNQGKLGLWSTYQDFGADFES